MYDPQGKKRELRRAISGGGFSLYRYYDRCHHGTRRWWKRDCGCSSFEVCLNQEYEWIAHRLGITVAELRGVSWGAPPADFRRELNKNYRNRSKAALRKAEINDDWDDFVLPAFHRDARWLYW